MKKSNFQSIINILFVFLILNNSCQKDPVRITKFSSTVATSLVSYNTASVKAKLMDIGEDIASYGHCWAIAPNPMISNFKTSNLGKPGKQVEFTSQMDGLSSGTKYYVRAYAVTAGKTVYSDEINFTTVELKDIENTVYKTVTIGTQVWMAENLKTKKYRNGDTIGTTYPADKDLSPETTPKYQWAYEGNATNIAAYGRLYSWYAATDPRNICPAGWHVPGNGEWAVLISFLGGKDIAGGKIKEIGTTHWTGPNTDANNSTSFSAVAGGGRNYANFYDLGKQAYFWTATADEYDPTGSSWAVELINISASIVINTYYPQKKGFSVRCVKD